MKGEIWLYPTVVADLKFSVLISTMRQINIDYLQRQTEYSAAAQRTE